jgi:Arf-GAP/SH3 domain/ANK repeat/PH domain-containing protein
MPEGISVADFIEQTWEDFNSPTTSTFDKKMTKCRNTVAQIEEVGLFNGVRAADSAKCQYF